VVRQRHGSNPAGKADLCSISSAKAAAALLTDIRSAELTTALNIRAANRSTLFINAADAAQH